MSVLNAESLTLDLCKNKSLNENVRKSERVRKCLLCGAKKKVTLQRRGFIVGTVSDVFSKRTDAN